MNKSELIEIILYALQQNRYVLLREKHPDEWGKCHAFCKIEKHKVILPGIESTIYVVGEPYWNGANWALDHIEIASDAPSLWDAIVSVGYLNEADFDINDNYEDFIWEVDPYQAPCDVTILPKGRWE